MKSVVGPEEVNLRFDVFVSQKFPTISRSYIQKILKEGDALVNSKVIKASSKLHSGDIVTINEESLQAIDPPEIDIPIIYEDSDCVVLDKQAGLLTHSKGNFNPEATVAGWLASRTTDLGGNRAGIVHRLDRQTSGVMICAKNPKAMASLQKQFSLRKVDKRYTAIIHGHLDPAVAAIDMPIERNPKKPSTFRVGPNGKAATTNYEVVKSSKQYDLVELMPKTGRTHQLRVHMRRLGHPILGDTLYGKDDAPRLFLHAHRLTLNVPSGKLMTFESKIPTSFKEVLDNDR